ncbi:MAG: hypothetical protein Q8M92_01490 [Candidatus Subteraquimicrobiales bacterium]|nr:hypothetical protein [Candidatus Subteraquimicrobiales bacterium]
MKEIICKIRKLLADRSFKDEQHVRISLVGRICQKFGWDIWNPAEFFTMYIVEKIPTQILPKDSNALSPTSRLVLGRSSRGYVDWLDDHGRKLDEYRK